MSGDLTLRIESVPGFPADIAVMFMRPELAADPLHRPSMLELLSEDERRKMDRFRFESDQNLFLTAHALLRLALSRYADVRPCEWRFETGAQGRPEIADPKSNLRFSLSHTPGLAACAITLDRDIGIDVEDASRSVELNVAERYFSAYEARNLRSLPATEQLERFFEYWTLKEAYIKATGMGLSMPLNRFSFHQDPNGLWRIEFAEAYDNPGRWKFWSFRIEQNYRIALAVATT